MKRAAGVTGSILILFALWILLVPRMPAWWSTKWSARQPGDRSLTVMAYASFISSWGPGPELAKLFEQLSGVQIRFVQADDAGVLLQRLRLVPADVVLGLDQFTLAMARAQQAWIAHDVAVDFPHGPDFLPFDWAPIGIVYRDGEIVPPKSFADLLAAGSRSRYSGNLALEDPRSSTPGFQFLRWIAAQKSDDELRSDLDHLRPIVHSVSPSWSQAYGLFSRGAAKMVLSYMTSPLYHMVTEKDSRFRFAEFKDGHVVHIEFAGIPSGTEHPEIARRFLRFLVSEEAQRVLMTKNWMLPVVVFDSFKRMEPFAAVLGMAEPYRPSADQSIEMTRSERERLFRIWGEAKL